LKTYLVIIISSEVENLSRLQEHHVVAVGFVFRFIIVFRLIWKWTRPFGHGLPSESLFQDMDCPSIEYDPQVAEDIEYQAMSGGHVLLWSSSTVQLDE
jgi:hypothetical protein